MKEHHVYIISCQRGQALPEIRSVWTDYEDAILAYYEDLADWDNQDFYLLHKLPVGRFCEPGKWCKEKLGKSSKNRLKFEDRELKNLIESINRNRQIDKIID